MGTTIVSLGPDAFILYAGLIICTAIFCWVTPTAKEEIKSLKIELANIKMENVRLKEELEKEKAWTKYYRGGTLHA